MSLTSDEVPSTTTLLRPALATFLRDLRAQSGGVDPKPLAKAAYATASQRQRILERLSMTEPGLTEPDFNALVDVVGSTL